MDNNELKRRLNKINKGDEIIRLGKDTFISERIPTGSYGLDIALGGGWPMGRTVVLFGKTGTIKSTLALITAGNAQKLGKNVLYIDSEKSFDADWASRFGIDMERISVIQSQSMETILDATYALLKKDDTSNKIDIDIIIVDSISTIQAEKYYDQEDEGHAAGTQAKVTKEILFKLSKWCPNALIIIISQVTTKLQDWRSYFGPTGGNALEHGSTVTVYLTAKTGEDILEKNEKKKKDGDDQDGIEMSPSDKKYKKWLGRTVHWKLEKSRVSIPGIVGQYAFYPDGGIDDSGEVIEAALKFGIVARRGGWFYLDAEKYHGREALEEALQDPKMMEELKNEISRKLARPTGA